MTNYLKQVRDALINKYETSGAAQVHVYPKDVIGWCVSQMIPATLDRLIAEKQQTPATLDECFEAAELLQDMAVNSKPSGDVAAALSALFRLENDALSSRDGYGYSSGDAETIRRVLAENEQLRKERDELAQAIIKIHEDQEGDYDFLKFISHPQYILAKKVNENGNA